MTSELPQAIADKNSGQATGEKVQIETGAPTKTVIIETGEGGRRKIVKKTVRIVKRIVRKKVVKPVHNCSAGTEELEKDVIIQPCREVSTSNIENFNAGDGNVKPCVGDEDLKKSEPHPMDVEKASIQSDAVPENVEMHESELTIPQKPLEFVKENPNSIENQNVGKEGVRQDDSGVSVNENTKSVEDKKTVRVVKRIVRKKVAKPVHNSSAGNEELEKDVRIEHIENFKAVDDNVTPHVGDGDLKKSEPQPMEVEKASIQADDVPENAKMDESELTIAEKPLEVVKENSNSIENENVGKEGVRQDDTGVSVNENAKSIEDIGEVLERDAEWSDEITLNEEATTKGAVEEVKEALESDIECSDKVTLNEETRTKGALEEEVKEVLESDIECSDKVTLNEETRTKGALEEEVKEVLESDIDCSDNVILSEEMEALERKRRRRTQIFIGGLEKDTKKEDIKRVFEDVGEIMELKLLINRETGKNKGFAFLRFASADDAKKAVTKYSQVEICGKQCGVSLVEGNDTLYLGNIDKKWKTQDVAKLLEKAGIDKIDKVTVIVDPNNAERNRGFAFVELETSRDAQIAFNKLQKKDVFGKHLQVRVDWAQPLIEPNEEEIQKVKSVFAECIPLSWDEAKVRDYFKRFGEIENVVIAKDLPSSRRKDFAFVNYTSREAALACITAFRHEEVNDESSEVKLKVSLARPMAKTKQIKHATNPTIEKPSREMRKVAYPILKVHKPSTKENPMRSDYGSSKVDRGSSSSSTNELLQLLRHQASARQTQSGLNISSSSVESQYSLSGSKRPLPLVRDVPLHFENRGFPRMRLENSFPVPNRSVLSHSLGAPSVPHSHLQGAHASDSVPGVAKYGRPFQTPEQTQYGGSSGLYRRYFDRRG